MRDLTLQELQELRNKMDPAYLKECAVAYGLVVTYFPALVVDQGKNIVIFVVSL